MLSWSNQQTLNFVSNLGKQLQKHKEILKRFYKNEALSHTHIFISQKTVMHIIVVNLNDATSCYLI